MSRFLAVRKHGGRVLLAIILLSASLAFYWYRYVGRVSEPGSPLPPSPLMESTAQMITRDFRHVETRLNRTVWVLEASIAEIFEKKARLQRVKISYFGQGDRPIIITGRQGNVDLESWDAVLVGDVRAVRGDGAVLKTRRLEWDNAEQTLRAPWPVKIRSGRLDIRGRRMLAKIDEKWVRLEGRVISVIRPRAGYFEPAT